MMEEGSRAYHNLTVLRYPVDSLSNDQVEVTIRDVNSLRHGVPLTPQIIDLWLKHCFLENIVDPDVRSSLYIFPSMFYISLTKGVPHGVNFGFIMPDVFTKEYLVVPVILGEDEEEEETRSHGHWMLVIVHLELDDLLPLRHTQEMQDPPPPDTESPTKKLKVGGGSLELQGDNLLFDLDLHRGVIFILDSDRNRNRGDRNKQANNVDYAVISSEIRKFLGEEWKLRRGDGGGVIFTPKNLTLQLPHVPQQKRGCDSGVFLLQFFEAIFTVKLPYPVHIALTLSSDLYYHVLEFIQELSEEDGGGHRGVMYHKVLELLDSKHGAIPNAGLLFPPTLEGLPAEETLNEAEYLSLFELLEEDEEGKSYLVNDKDKVNNNYYKGSQFQAQSQSQPHPPNENRQRLQEITRVVSNFFQDLKKKTKTEEHDGPRPEPERMEGLEKCKFVFHNPHHQPQKTEEEEKPRPMNNYYQVPNNNNGPFQPSSNFEEKNDFGLSSFYSDWMRMEDEQMSRRNSPRPSREGEEVEEMVFYNDHHPHDHHDDNDNPSYYYEDSMKVRTYPPPPPDRPPPPFQFPDPMDPERAQEVLGVDYNEPLTTITVKMADGSRLMATLNRTQKVSVIREFICMVRPEQATTPFALITVNQRRKIDEKLTMQEAHLIDAVIHQVITDASII